LEKLIKGYETGKEDYVAKELEKHNKLIEQAYRIIKAKKEIVENRRGTEENRRAIVIADERAAKYEKKLAKLKVKDVEEKKSRGKSRTRPNSPDTEQSPSPRLSGLLRRNNSPILSKDTPLPVVPTPQTDQTLLSDRKGKHKSI
jgi:hypothetical protein